MGADGLPARQELLLAGGYVLSMDPALGDLPVADVHVRDGEIVAVGPSLDAPGATRLDASGSIVMPGFVDTHWHLWNTSLRPYVRNPEPERSYFPVTKALGPFFTPEDTRRGTRLALVEALLSGFTTVHDWSHNVLAPEYADASIEVLRAAGIRARFSYGPGQGQPLDRVMDVDGVRAVRDRWWPHGRRDDDLLHLGVASRNLVPGQSLRGSIPLDIAHRDYAAARELGLPITLHASPPGLVLMLAEEGLLGPDLQLVHPMQTTAQEARLLAAASTSYSISALGEVERGPLEQVRLHELLSEGVRVSLSVDSSLADGADMFAIMRALYKANGNRLGPDTGLTHRRMVELATIDGARDLGLDHLVGSITPGKRADVVLVDRMAPNLAPPGDPVTQIVSLAQPHNVTTVIVDGRVLVRDRAVLGVDVAEVVQQACDSADEVGQRAGWAAA